MPVCDAFLGPIFNDLLSDDVAPAAARMPRAAAAVASSTQLNTSQISADEDVARNLHQAINGRGNEIDLITVDERKPPAREVITLDGSNSDTAPPPPKAVGPYLAPAASTTAASSLSEFDHLIPSCTAIIPHHFPSFTCSRSGNG